MLLGSGGIGECIGRKEKLITINFFLLKDYESGIKYGT